jgi:hypothetical protein
MSFTRVETAVATPSRATRRPAVSTASSAAHVASAEANAAEPRSKGDDDAILARGWM